MHPNAEIARELNQCVKSQDEELAILGLRRGLIIRESAGPIVSEHGKFKLTKKGVAFVAKWGGKEHVPSGMPSTPSSTPLAQTTRMPQPSPLTRHQQPAYSTRSRSSSRYPSQRTDRF